VDEQRDKAVPEADEAHRGEHNEVGYHNADEGQTFDERGSQTEGPGESERDEGRRVMTDSPTRQERKLAGSGGRLMAIGAPLVVIGVVLALLLDHNWVGLGVAIAVLCALPLVAGAALTLSALVQRRDRQDKPWV
jgi:hypothetical protein